MTRLLLAVALVILSQVPGGREARGQQVVPGTPDSPPFRLAPPLDCAHGDGCFILNYPDADPGAGFRDFRCGPLGYDGHRGVDIALPDLASLRRGHAVRAAADGVVAFVRNHVPDVHAHTIGLEVARRAGYGNLVIIDHRNGVTTYYAHLRQGSVSVHTGAYVSRGQVIGTVGMSGLTVHPHLHFEVRRHNVPHDPYTGLPLGNGCNRVHRSLWTTGALDSWPYTATRLIAGGFADQPLTHAALLHGYAASGAISGNTPDLLLHAQVAGVRAGDRYRLEILAPGGITIFDQSGQWHEDAAVRLAYGGKTNIPAPLEGGVYLGRFSLYRPVGRDDLLSVIQHTWDLRVQP